VRTLIVLMVLVVPGGLFAEENDAQTEGLFNKGDEFLQAKNYDQALVMYRAAEAVAKDKSHAWLMIGTTYIAENDCRQGMPYLQKYLDSRNKEGRSSVLRMMTACQASQNAEQRAAATPPPPAAPPPATVERPAAPSPAAPAPGVEERIADDRLSVVTPGVNSEEWWIADGRNQRISENEFVRRYRRLTGSSAIDFANKPAKKGMDAALGVGITGVILSGVGAGMFGVHDGGNVGIGLLVPGGLMLIGGLCVGLPLALKADPAPTVHRLTLDQTRQRVEEYNRALADRARQLSSWLPARL
jgi:hypothetical protein